VNREHTVGRRVKELALRRPVLIETFGEGANFGCRLLYTA